MKTFAESAILYIAVFIAFFFVLVPGLAKTFTESLTGISIVFIGIITVSVSFLTYSTTYGENSQERKKLRAFGGNTLKSALNYLIGTVLFVFYSLVFSSNLIPGEIQSKLVEKSWLAIFDWNFIVSQPAAIIPLIGLTLFGVIILLIFTKSGELMVKTIWQYYSFERSKQRKRN